MRTLTTQVGLILLCAVLLTGVDVAAPTPQSGAVTHQPSSVQPSGAATSAAAEHTDQEQALQNSKVLSVSQWFSSFAQHRIAVIVLGSLGGLILAATATALILVGHSAGQPRIPTLNPSFFFWLEVGYLLLLLVIAALYVLTWDEPQPLLLAGVLPIGVPWFGAVGAVVISLEGIFAYAHKGWDASYSYWHIGRPLFGAVLGIVAFFTYVLIIISSGSVPAFLDGHEASRAPKDYIVYYIVAFVVGYREETFRELIRRVTDLILKPSDSSANVPAVTFKQGGASVVMVDFGKVTTAATKSITIAVQNTGKVPLKSPTAMLEAPGSPEYAIRNDQLTGSTELKAGESKSLDIAFSPTVAGNFNTVLVLTAGNLSNAAKLPVTGSA